MLRIDGIPGDIKLPLNVATARRLIRQARQAPYGIGSETIVDTAVRNTWELDAAQFSFNKPNGINGSLESMHAWLGS